MSKKMRPTSAMVIKSITSKSVLLPEEEAHREMKARADSDNNDEAVYQAYFDLAKKSQRFHALPDNPAIIECPTQRLMRIGDEAIKDGHPSALFSFLLEQIRGGRTLPHVTSRALNTAQKRLTIANAFVAFMTEFPPLTSNFMEAKRKFRLSLAFADRAPSQATVDDALAAHDLGWSSYDIKWIPKKRKKREEGISCRNLCIDFL